MHVLLLVYVALLGLVVGSFLTVVIHRVPLGLSIVAPRSRCPSCGETIGGRDNVPLVSFVLRLGRCHNCGAAISWRYPATELLTALLFLVLALRLPSAWEIPAFCVLAATLVALGAIDLEHLRVPTRILWWGAALGLPLLVLASSQTHRWSALWVGLACGAASAAALFALHLAVPRGMGLGDVRLAGFSGLFLGWIGVRYCAVGLWLGFLLGGLVAIVLLALRRTRVGAHLPFAPFLAAGALASVLLAPEIARLPLG